MIALSAVRAAAMINRTARGRVRMAGPEGGVCGGGGGEDLRG